MMLMCKNTPVYDIEKEKTLNYNLLPGLMQQKGADNHTFTKWMKYRYSSGTNTIARKLKGITFGHRTENSTNMAIFPWNCNVLSFAGNAEFL